MALVCKEEHRCEALRPVLEKFEADLVSNPHWLQMYQSYLIWLLHHFTSKSIDFSSEFYIKDGIDFLENLFSLILKSPEIIDPERVLFLKKRNYSCSFKSKRDGNDQLTSCVLFIVGQKQEVDVIYGLAQVMWQALTESKTEVEVDGREEMVQRLYDF